VHVLPVHHWCRLAANNDNEQQNKTVAHRRPDNPQQQPATNNNNKPAHWSDRAVFPKMGTGASFFVIQQGRVLHALRFFSFPVSVGEPLPLVPSSAHVLLTERNIVWRIGCCVCNSATTTTENRVDRQGIHGLLADPGACLKGWWMAV
jgi:hypothetical protein